MNEFVPMLLITIMALVNFLLWFYGGIPFDLFSAGLCSGILTAMVIDKYIR